MSSTDERELRRFFVERLTPAAQALRARGVRFFATGAEPDAGSWYESAPAEPDFVVCGEEDLEAALAARWSAQGLPELERLAAALMALADGLELGEAQSADVSPFVYVMY